jgi:hypothetical protein
MSKQEFCIHTARAALKQAKEISAELTKLYNKAQEKEAMLETAVAAYEAGHNPATFIKDTLKGFLSGKIAIPDAAPETLQH